MKVRSFSPVLILVSLLAWGALALASADPQQLTIRDILTQQTQLRAQVVAGKGAFKDMSKAERAALVERQDRVLQMLGGLQTLEDMAPDQRTVVFNDLEWIKAAVTKAEDDRMVCEYTRTVGSNRMQSVCMTAKQQRENRDGSQDSLRRTFKCDSCRGD
jgi:DNA gyrase/topoisomerase IV subunit A